VSHLEMANRILVTGANKGVGLAIVNRCLLDHDDTHCIMACRSKKRGEEAKEELIKAHSDWQQRISVLEMDTSSDASVKAAAEVLAGQLGAEKLYAIVNNAGIGKGSISEMLQVNVYGPHRVDAAFLPMLKEGGRIVNISSGAGPRSVQASSPERRQFFMDPDVTWPQITAVMDELLTCEDDTKKKMTEKGIGVFKGPTSPAYGATKALLNCYTAQMARENPQYIINSCSPGAIATDFFNFPGACLMKCCLSSPDKGTVSTMHLLFDELEGNGKFYHKTGRVTPFDKY